MASPADAVPDLHSLPIEDHAPVIFVQVFVRENKAFQELNSFTETTRLLQ